MNKPNFLEEKKLWKKGFKCVVGLDEAGRGPLAGPVVAAAVIINSKFEYRNSKQFRIIKTQNQKRVSDFVLRISDLDVRDSKQMTAKQREDVYKKIINCLEIRWGVGIVSEKVIDKINILQATKLAMQKALNKLAADYLLIDGNFSINSSVPQRAVIKGDQEVISIAMASIIAKVTRDKLMQKYHKKYPHYGFDKHKGYGTAFHMQMLEKYGPCLIHRKSFWPVSKY